LRALGILGVVCYGTAPPADHADAPYGLLSKFHSAFASLNLVAGRGARDVKIKKRGLRPVFM